MRFNVGDTVRVKEDLHIGKYGSDYFLDEMLEYKGKCYTVKHITASYQYNLMGCDDWNFTDEMLEPAEFTQDDLQINDIVKWRRGIYFMVHEFQGKLILVSKYNHGSLENFNGLKSKYDDTCDIVEVRRPEETYQLKEKCWERAPIVYQEKEDFYKFDELVEVSDDGIYWNKRYYAGRIDNKHYCWRDGRTSETAEDEQGILAWNYIRKCEQ